MSYLGFERLTMTGSVLNATLPGGVNKVLIIPEAPLGEILRFAINTTASTTSPKIPATDLILSIWNLLQLSFYGPVGTYVDVLYFAS
jgi:hypothetical protein